MFDRLKSVKYALKWAYSFNPMFYNFSYIGGDCTNFVSQCLYFGGIDMDYNLYGWFYTSLNNRAPAWSGVNEFWNYAIKEKSHSLKIKQCSLDEVELSDIIQLYNGERYYHNLIVTDIRNGIKVSAHDFSARNIPLNYYNYTSLRCGKIIS